MNWQMMLCMAIFIIGAVLVTSLCCWLIDRFDLHPYWIFAGLSAAAILAVGLLPTS